MTKATFNASGSLVNTLIGEYSVLDDDKDEEPLLAYESADKSSAFRTFPYHEMVWTSVPENTPAIVLIAAKEPEHQQQ